MLEIAAVREEGPAKASQSIDRWSGVTRPRPAVARACSVRRLALAIVLAWGLPLVLAVLPVCSDLARFRFFTYLSFCGLDSTLYDLILAVSLYPLQLGLVLLSHVSFFCYVLRTSRRMREADASSVSGTLQARRHGGHCGRGGGGGGDGGLRRQLWKRQVDVTKNMAYVVLAFVACMSSIFISILVGL